MQCTATSHVHFDTRFEYLWVSERTVVSCVARKNFPCEVADATLERRKHLFLNELLLRKSHFLSKAQIETGHEGFAANGSILRW